MILRHLYSLMYYEAFEQKHRLLMVSFHIKKANDIVWKDRIYFLYTPNVKSMETFTNS